MGASAGVSLSLKRTDWSVRAALLIEKLSGALSGSETTEMPKGA
jgi:hypothetical protein